MIIMRIGLLISIAAWSFVGAMEHKPHRGAIEQLCQAASKDTTGSVVVNLCKNTLTEVINGHDENGLTPLHYAAFYGNVEAVKALLACGALATIRGKKVFEQTWTGIDMIDLPIVNDVPFLEPLHLAAYGGLLRKETLLCHFTSWGPAKRLCPLDVKTRFVAIANLLMDAGASPATSHKGHKSPYEIARHCSDSTELTGVLAKRAGWSDDAWARVKSIMDLQVQKKYSYDFE